MVPHPSHLITGIIYGSKVFRYEQITFPITARISLKDGHDFIT